MATSKETLLTCENALLFKNDPNFTKENTFINIKKKKKSILQPNFMFILFIVILRFKIGVHPSGPSFHDVRKYA